MFRTLLTNRTTRFDHFVRIALASMTAAFLIGVGFGVIDMGTAPVEQVATSATVTFEFISVEAIMPKVGGALVQLPMLRF